MIYITAVKSDQCVAPSENLEKFVRPTGTYAVFKNPSDRVRFKLLNDYIYAIWLPQSPFGRDQAGFVHHAFYYDTINNKLNSYSKFLVPVRLKN